MEVFAEDWVFTTDEELVGDAWFPTLRSAGNSLARCVRAGPDEDFRTVPWIIEGALACARNDVRIVTPYFLPDASLVSALNVAAMRGVRVDIILPSKNNLTMVHWASRAQWWQVLEHGCRIWLSPPPFDHTKLMVVDGAWSLVGSANWDPRSLRLNFELDVECYDLKLAGDLTAIVERKRAGAREVTLAEVDGRPLAMRLRDGMARVFSPFL